MSIKLNWSKNAVENLSKFPDKVVGILIQQAQISQAKISNAAKADHGADAHGQGRYVSRSGDLTKSIIPGPVTVTADGVEFTVIAQIGYAGYVEGEKGMKTTDIGVFPFLGPAAQTEMPFFIARLRLGMEGIRF